MPFHCRGTRNHIALEDAEEGENVERERQERVGLRPRATSENGAGWRP